MLKQEQGLKNMINFCLYRSIEEENVTLRDLLKKLILSVDFKYFFSVLINSVILIAGLLIAVAYLTLLERKLMASIQRRKGPNVVGFWGILQPLADGLKLIGKELIIPYSSNRIIFLFSPLFMFIMSLLCWAVIPWTNEFIFFDYQYSLLYIIAISSLSVFGVILAGWSSNSKYSFLGSLRSTAQMISYEITLSFIYIIIAMFSNTLNLQEIIIYQQKLHIWFIFPFFPLAIIFFCGMLAETNRAPFDLPEAEAELVSGYNTEYSSIIFAFFFLAEYANMLLMSALFSILFLGGWSQFPLIILPQEVILPIKIVLTVVIFIWVRATLPRYRYDQLMILGWKVFLPLLLAFFIFYASLKFICLI